MRKLFHLLINSLDFNILRFFFITIIYIQTSRLSERTYYFCSLGLSREFLLLFLDRFTLYLLIPKGEYLTL